MAAKSLPVMEPLAYTDSLRTVIHRARQDIQPEAEMVNNSADHDAVFTNNSYFCAHETDSGIYSIAFQRDSMAVQPDPFPTLCPVTSAQKDSCKSQVAV